MGQEGSNVRRPYIHSHLLDPGAFDLVEFAPGRGLDGALLEERVLVQALVPMHACVG